MKINTNLRKQIDYIIDQKQKIGNYEVYQKFSIFNVVIIAIQEVLRHSDELVKKTMVEDSAEKITAEEYVRQKRNWENELERIRSLLHNTQMVRKLDLIHKSKVMSSYNFTWLLKHEFGIFFVFRNQRRMPPIILNGNTTFSY